MAGRLLQDLEFYARLARDTGGPILELGCGTGRLTRPLAAIGYDVLGVDLDPDMLGWSAPGVELVQADMRSFDLSRDFPLVIVPYNTLQLLTTAADQQACFAAVRRHLRPGGELGLEVTDFVSGVVTDVLASEPLGSAEGITLYGSLVTDTERRVSRYERRFLLDDGDPPVTDVVTLRHVDEADLAELAAGVGLDVVESRRDARRLWWVAQVP